MYEYNLAKQVYKSSAEDLLLIHNKFIKWKQEIGEGYEEDLQDFGRRHLDIYQTTNIAEYRIFQYRLLQRAIVTNIQLHRWNFVTSNICSLCKEEPETPIHLLCTCRISKTIWENIAHHLRQEYHIREVTIDVKSILFNEITGNKRCLGNFICLLTKHYIYSQKCLGKQPNINNLIAQIRTTENLEKYIAMKNGKLSQHHKKWMRPQS